MLSLDSALFSQCRHLADVFPPCTTQRTSLPSPESSLCSRIRAVITSSVTPLLRRPSVRPSNATVVPPPPPALARSDLLHVRPWVTPKENERTNERPTGGIVAARRNRGTPLLLVSFGEFFTTPPTVMTFQLLAKQIGERDAAEPKWSHRGI